MLPWHVKAAVALLVSLPALVLRLAGVELPPLISLVAFGSAIVGAAFLLAWAAEAAQIDISASLATAVLALIAVLPEYAVDLYFAYASGTRPEYAQYAAANMTGSNRLLLGLGWPVVAFVFAWGLKRRRERQRPLTLEPRRRVELGFLVAAGAYAFLIPLTGRISLLDTVVLLALFALYIGKVARQERSEPELIGVAAALGVLPRARRRAAVVGFFIAAGAFILASAEPFAHALVESGAELGLDEFLLVQWLAPLASETPEFLVAALLAFRGRQDAALGTLLSSKVNQWTLLVGSIPLAHLAGGGGLALALDARQNEEFLLTAAQTVLGFAMLLNLRFRLREAWTLLALFGVQFAFPQPEVRVVFSVVYLILAAFLIMRERRMLLAALRAVAPDGMMRRPRSRP
ncbi:MAG: sodium:proton exchanger [Thermoleophilia bacterium]|nr:sodium:proton exchanger [Thermoleophilia bacterium]